jgi:replicative superfamily II helicase
VAKRPLLATSDSVPLITALPLPAREPEAPQTPEELFGRLQVVDSRLDNLWAEQADALRAYASDHIGSSDVALELPTGSGKTLVGLLIAEWRRQHQKERAAYVCPTNQLARQIHEKSHGYGIDPDRAQ